MPDHLMETPDSAPCGTVQPGFLAGLAQRCMRPLGIGLVLAGCGFALVAASQRQPDLGAARFSLAPQPAPQPAAMDIGQLSGFQRRGNTLIGEVITRDGTALRLVFDARTHALIGIRVLAEASPREPPSAKSPLRSPVPLPDAKVPAN